MNCQLTGYTGMPPMMANMPQMRQPRPMGPQPGMRQGLARPITGAQQVIPQQRQGKSVLSAFNSCSSFIVILCSLLCKSPRLFLG